MNAQLFKHSVIIEQKNDKIIALIEGYREILRHLDNLQNSVKSNDEKYAYFTARNIVEETMSKIADINLTDN